MTGTRGARPGDDHPVQAISAWLDGELAPAEAERLQEHLRDCAACRAVVHDLRRLGAAVQGEEVPPVPSDLAARIGARIDAASGADGRAAYAGPGAHLWSRWGGTVMAAAASLTAGAVLWIVWQSSPGPGRGAPEEFEARGRLEDSRQDDSEAMLRDQEMLERPKAAPPPTPLSTDATRRRDSTGDRIVEEREAAEESGRRRLAAAPPPAAGADRAPVEPPAAAAGARAAGEPPPARAAAEDRLHAPAAAEPAPRAVSPPATRATFAPDPDAPKAPTEEEGGLVVSPAVAGTGAALVVPGDGWELRLAADGRLQVSGDAYSCELQLQPEKLGQERAIDGVVVPSGDFWELMRTFGRSPVAVSKQAPPPPTPQEAEGKAVWTRPVAPEERDRLLRLVRTDAVQAALARECGPPPAPLRPPSETADGP